MTQPLPPILKAAFMVFCLLLTVVTFFKNLPNSPIGQDLHWVHSNVTNNLGLLHTGWGLFEGPLTISILARIRYTYADGHDEVWDVYPLRSSLLRSAWTQVAKKVIYFDNNNDVNGYIKQGFLRYECTHGHEKLARVRVQTEYAQIPISELEANGGFPRTPPHYQILTSLNCNTVRP